VRLIGDFKSAVKRSHRLYPLAHKLRRWQQDRQIQREQRECEAKARELGMPPGEEPAEQVFGRLTSRLAARGISWPPRPTARPLHILYASTLTEWEPYNIPDQLATIGQVTLFPLNDHGIPLDRGYECARQLVDRELPRFVRRLHEKCPVDMLLSYLSGSLVSSHTLDEICSLGIPTFGFHLDDRFSFYGGTSGDQWRGPAAVCRSYDLNLTNAPRSLIKYRVNGANVLFWPQGANPDFFQPLDVPLKYGVTFCGQRYGVRRVLVEYLRKNGVDVQCFGSAWENGYQTAEELVRIVNQSRICLGVGYVMHSSDQCLKGRDFEIPSCGAVYLTSWNEDLRRVYRLGEEIETYGSFDDCLQKITRLLASPGQCHQLRQRARAAVVRRHTWAERVRELLECRGLPGP